MRNRSSRMRLPPSRSRSWCPSRPRSIALPRQLKQRRTLPEEAAIVAELEREEAELLAAIEAEEQQAAEEEALSAAEATSLRDLPEDIWSIPTGPGQAEPSQIRFAEDITGLRGGVTARRARRSGNQEGESPTASAGARGRRRRGRPARRRR